MIKYEKSIDNEYHKQEQIKDELNLSNGFASKREADMVAMRAKGYTYIEIAKKYGISKQRVHQIIDKYKKEPGLARNQVS